MTTSTVNGVAGERIIQFIEKIETIEEQQAGLSSDKSEIYAEAKSAGLETKAIRQIVKLRKMDRQKRQEQEEILDLYKAAIGLE